MTFNPGVGNIGFAIAEFSGIDSVGATDTDTGSGTAHTSHSISNVSGSVIIYVDSELSTAVQSRTYSGTLLAGSNDGTGFTFGSRYTITSSTSTWPQSVTWWSASVEYKH